ncbi:MAG: hypothetical protein IJ569_06400 [Prevotella sp.]|nr:hypothetical protein [Prevotella sp.]
MKKYLLSTMLLCLAMTAVAQAEKKSKIVEDGGTGPYKAVMLEEASLPAHTVFVPQDLTPFNSQKPLPVLVWGNGACTNSPWEHFKFLNEIASFGYIVLATGYIPMEEEPYQGPMSSTEQQIESIDWALAQNANPQSPYYQKIDTKNICVAGMSCGGLQTLFNCADPRITSLMICNSGLFNQQNAFQAVGGMPMPQKSKLKEIHTPIIYILGGKEDIAYENGMDDFHRIDHVPACAANFPVGHGGTYRQPHGGEFTVVALAWLNWQLKGDAEAAKLFKGEDCLLPKRQGWTLEKNALFDHIPQVYTEENTGRQFPAPVMPEASALPVIKDLPDALAWSNGSGRVVTFQEWERRRNEIAAQIQHYGIGTKPSVAAEQVKARMEGDTLYVEVTVNGQTLTLHSTIHYPKVGQPPYALMIGTSMLTLPKPLLEDRPIAVMNFHEAQVNDYSQWRKHHERGEHDFDRLYPDLKDNGAYSEWAWGMSRLIDGLQQLGEAQTKIDMKRIGVSGCSYAGKMALFCGAFDERIALTIAQEPGGGGAAAWRISHRMDSVECLDKTDYHWFLESQRDNFRGDSVYQLPYDHHELCAMVCPRALLLLGNPDYKWLADESMRVSAEAARQVWQQFGIGDRFACDIVGGHPHCQLPESQYPIVGRFLDYLLEIEK